MSASVFVLFFIISTLGWYSTCVTCGPVNSVPSEEPALLIVSYDGFHPDWIDEKTTPNLFKFRRDGVSAPYMQNVFPTKTFTNHFSIATGFYPETHGVMGSGVFDLDENAYLRHGEKMYKFKKDIKPIWTLNQQAENKHSGCMMWSGSNFDFHNTTISHFQKISIKMPHNERVDTALSWFSNKTHPANLVMMYIEDPDFQAHIHGCESQMVKNKIKEVDELTGYIQEQLIALKLDKRVNVIHLSDHGLVDVKLSELIKLKENVKGDYEIYGVSPVVQIVPNDTTKTTEVYANFEKLAKKDGHFNVYNYTNFPEKWHANNKRMGPIIAVADVGYAFYDDMIKKIEQYQRDGVPIHELYANHGYDNFHRSMRAMFMAKGPHFKEKQKLDPVKMVNLYNLFCLILNLECEINDGSTDMNIWKNLFKVLPTLKVKKNVANANSCRRV